MPNVYQEIIKFSFITSIRLLPVNYRPSGFGGLQVLAFGTQVRRFKPGRSLRIFQGEKILSTPSFEGEVKPSVPCRRLRHVKDP